MNRGLASGRCRILQHPRSVIASNEKNAIQQQRFSTGDTAQQTVREKEMTFFKGLFVLGALCLLVAGGCVSSDDDGGVPADFMLIVDTYSADKDVVQNVNVRINAKGQGRYEKHNTGGVIRGDTNNMVTYEASQVVEAGEFRVSEDSLKRLWEAIEENHFFELTGDYRMAMGHSYAFVLVEAGGQKHQVFNIGMEVSEIKEIIEATKMILPEGVNLEYRKRFVP